MDSVCTPGRCPGSGGGTPVPLALGSATRMFWRSGTPCGSTVWGGAEYEGLHGDLLSVHCTRHWQQHFPLLGNPNAAHGEQTLFSLSSKPILSSQIRMPCEFLI